MKAFDQPDKGRWVPFLILALPVIFLMSAAAFIAVDRNGARLGDQAAASQASVSRDDSKAATSYDPAEVAQFIKEFKVSYPIVMGTQEVADAYGPVQAIPATFIIDRAGLIVRRHLGPVSLDDLKDEIKPRL